MAAAKNRFSSSCETIADDAFINSNYHLAQNYFVQVNQDDDQQKQVFEALAANLEEVEAANSELGGIDQNAITMLKDRYQQHLDRSRVCIQQLKSDMPHKHRALNADVTKMATDIRATIKNYPQLPDEVFELGRMIEPVKDLAIDNEYFQQQDEDFWTKSLSGNRLNYCEQT